MLLLAAVATGCSDSNEQFIQGTWYYLDAHLQSVAGETRQEVFWTFDRGTFEYYTCCFNGEFQQSGQYRIVESKDNVLTLELFNQRGHISADRSELRLVTHKNEDTLDIQGAGPFERALSSSQSP